MKNDLYVENLLKSVEFTCKFEKPYIVAANFVGMCTISSVRAHT